MGSSSGESFLWTDASSNSNNMSIISDAPEFEQEPFSAISPKKKIHVSHLEHLNDGESVENHKRVKKRKTDESNDSFLPQKKQIKLEPESDIDAVKKKKLKKHTTIEDESNNSNLDDESHLNITVKQEQPSLVVPEFAKSKKHKRKKHKSCILKNGNENNTQFIVDPNTNEIESYLELRVKEEQVPLTASEDVKAKKKKKHKKSFSNVDNESDSMSVEELNKTDVESYINMRVKEEQASMIETEAVNTKKKKNRKSSITSDIENAGKFKSTSQSTVDSFEKDNTEYVIFQEKFCAEETVIEKPKKKKHNKDKFNSSICDTNYIEEHSSVDTSLQSKDCILSKIDSSSESMNICNTMENKQKADNITEDALRRNDEIHRKTKISDRIRFEDDDSLRHKELNLNEASKVNVFLKANPLLQFAPKIQDNITVSEDDEIWIIRCPHEMKRQNLKNTTMSLEGKCKIKIDGQTYDGILTENINSLTLMTYEYGQPSVSNWPVKGFVNYHKKIPKSCITGNINIANNQINFIPLPETKCRHPLFGANYKKAMKIPVAIKERLEIAKSRHLEVWSETTITNPKKSKNKFNDMNKEDYYKSKSEDSKKNRKRKISQDKDVPPKKKKHKKHNSDSAEVWESEKAIEENLFNF